MNNQSFFCLQNQPSGQGELVPEIPELPIKRFGTKISIQIPFPSLTSVFYRKTRDGVFISSDLRSMYRKNDTLDIAGIASLLLIGATVPPLTPFKDVHALLPGFTHTIDLETQELNSEVSCNWSTQSIEDLTRNIDRQSEIIAYLLDNTLENLCPTKNPIVLFSGGVDSSLIASRLSWMGWKQTSFIHHSFGEQDEETVISKIIANELGIPLDVVKYNVDFGLESLSNAAKLYSMPFCDHSCVPTHSLTCAVESQYEGNRIVFDGTGADACFGEFTTAYPIKRLYSIPNIIRRIFGAPYNLLNLWRTSGLFEYYSRLMRRSTVTNELLFYFAENPLLGMGYFIDPKDISLLLSCCINWISSITDTLYQTKTNSEFIPVMDLGWGCAELYAQKNRNPLLIGEFIPKYPYLEHQVVDLALTRARFWPGSTYPKNVLRYLLSNSVPRKYVYRKKRASSTPLLKQFSHPLFLEHLNAATEQNSPLYDLINIPMVKKLLDDLFIRRMLPSQTYNFVWAIAFCSAWLTQVENSYQELKVEFY